MSTKPFTHTTRRLNGFTVRTIESRSLHADGFDYDNGENQFLTLSAHDVTEVTVSEGTTTTVVKLQARTEDGRTVHVSLFGVTLDTLAAAVSQAQAQVTA